MNEYKAIPPGLLLYSVFDEDGDAIGKFRFSNDAAYVAMAYGKGSKVFRERTLVGVVKEGMKLVDLHKEIEQAVFNRPFRSDNAILKRYGEEE